jgi:hypothetical protein
MKQSTSLVRRIAIPMVIALMALGIGTAALAAKKSEKMKAKEFTCEEFLTLGTEVQPRVVYWLDGLSKSGKLEEAEVDVDAFERPVAMVVTQCHKTPKATVLEKVKKYF